MSTWTLPINARLVSDSTYTASGYTFPQTGYVPTRFAVPIVVASVTGAAASITNNCFIVPAGYSLDDVKVVVATPFTGTSVASASVDFKVGNGALANQASLLTTANIATAGPTVGNANATGVLCSALAADTTITYTVSVSGTAAQGATTASLTAGAATLLLTIGVPYNSDTRA